MQIDFITLTDLSIFSKNQTEDVFSLIDKTTTSIGRKALRKMFVTPPTKCSDLRETQKVVQFFTRHLNDWPTIISNGTVLMLEKFFDSAEPATTGNVGVAVISSDFIQRIFNRREFFLTKFSLNHLKDFLIGCRQITKIGKDEEKPDSLQQCFALITEYLETPEIEEILAIDDKTRYRQLANLQRKVRFRNERTFVGLMEIYARLDAWISMARATTERNWTFPVIDTTDKVQLRVKGLYHPLVSDAVAYDVEMDETSNFMVLTGANMSGKTTYLRSIGVATLLAHIGMGVPAASFETGFFHGIITNMHVEDNILKGESYFLAEVKRMKDTVEKILDKRPRLVLMDELFKGTNVHDAHECTKAVVEGLIKFNNHIKVLSTHLYEVAHQFETHPSLCFYYFQIRSSEQGMFEFTYVLKKGISNDRIGYRILQKEGVIDLLTQPKNNL